MHTNLFYKTLIIALSCYFFSSQQVSAQKTDWNTLLKERKYERIIEEAQSAKDKKQFKQTEWQSLGEAYEGMLNHREAYKCYLQVFQTDSTNNAIIYKLAEVCTSMGKGNEAIGYYQLLTTQDSTAFTPRYETARIYYQMTEYDQALKIYNQLIEEYPENPNLYYEAGNCLTKNGDNTKAFEYYNMAYSLNPENPFFAANVINFYLKSIQGGAIAAIALCQDALMHNPGNKQIRQYQGLAHFIAEDYKTAKNIYNSLLTEGDSSYMTLKYGGASLYNNTDYFDAIEILEPAYQKDTTAAEVALLLGGALGKTYDSKRGLAYLDVAEKNMQPPKILVEKIVDLRADILKRESGKKDQFIAYCYQSWKEDTTRLRMLQQMTAIKFISDLASYQTEEEMEVSLLAHILLFRHIPAPETDSTWVKKVQIERRVLKLFDDYMALENLSTFPMRSPDGETMTVDKAEISHWLQMYAQQNQEEEDEWKSSSVQYVTDFYKYWVENDKPINVIKQLANNHSAIRPQFYPTEQARQIGLGVNVLYAQERIRLNDKTKDERLKRSLNSFLEYMEQKKINALPTQLPDESKGSIQRKELKALIEKAF